MNFSFIPSLEKRESADLLVLPCWEGPVEAADFGSLKKAVSSALASGDFKGKSGEGVLLYVSGEKEPRLYLLGLGKAEKVSSESLRRSFANAIRIVQSKKVKSLNLLVPKVKNLSREELLTGVGEGVLLTNYAFLHLKGDSLKDNPLVLLEKVGWIGVDRKEEERFHRFKAVAAGVSFIRELVNGNADDVTPKMLMETALSLEKSSPRLKATIFDKKRLEQEKMGLLLAVNRGSSLDPFLIQVAYRGNPRSKEHIVLVGKGITYDTGGLCLKTADGMLTMKVDMAGAATALGVVQTAAALKLKVNATALIPATENCIGSRSYKPGDVYRGYSGKMVEVTNTDAEGRLVLADALAYAVKNLRPSCLVDLATLTGSIIFALGEEIAGLFSNDEGLTKGLMASSEKTGELLWRMPLYAEYKEALKSEIGDIVNASGRDAGAIKAALFLQEFIGTTPWAHLDIAGAAYLSKAKYYNTTRATGFGLRLLIDFLEKRATEWSLS